LYLVVLIGLTFTSEDFEKFRVDLFSQTDKFHERGKNSRNNPIKVIIGSRNKMENNRTINNQTETRARIND